MAKYANVLRDVEELFANKDSNGNRTTWSTHKIQAFPSNYQGGSFEDEFVKIEMIPSTPNTNYGQFGVSGVYIIQIYTRAGDGLVRSTEIADILDTILQAKHLKRGTQTGTSSLSFLGIDNDDNSLFRADYQVGFRNYN